MTGPLQGQRVLVVGRGSGIARAVALAARDAGAKVIAAGRDKDTLTAAYAGEPQSVLAPDGTEQRLGRRLDKGPSQPERPCATGRGSGPNRQ